MFKECKYCGGKFEITGNKQYCTPSCKKKNQGSRRKPPVLHSCNFCGVPFLQRRKDNITCSASCSQKLWAKNNPQKNFLRNSGPLAKIRHKNWRANNLDKVRATKQRYKKKRRNIDIHYYLNEKMSNSIRIALLGEKVKNWESIVGYTQYDLKLHLEGTLPNITWEEFLKEDYHIDHIIPKSLYTFKDEDDPEFKKCWDLKNLRIIPANENLEKLASLDMNLVKFYKIEHLLPNNF